MIKNPTAEEVEMARKEGLRIGYNSQGVPVRIMSREEMKEADANWDDEFHCPKRVAEFWRRAREWERERKKM